MKPTAKYLLLTVFALATLYGCNVVHGPKVDPLGFPGSANKVLLEDFTGHLCGYCPDGHEKAQALVDLYGENLVVVAIHAGSLAQVIPGYETDFKTPMGTELDNYFGASSDGLPKGLVNRRVWNGRVLTGRDNWGSLVAPIFSEPAKIALEVTPSYSASDGILTADVHLQYLTAGTAEHYLVAVVTEDSIVSKQKDYNLPPTEQDVEDYVQNHVLRGSITSGTWGDRIKNQQIYLGEQFDKTYQMTLNPDWNPAHCNVVVYIRDAATQEVLQVEQVKVIQ